MMDFLCALPVLGNILTACAAPLPLAAGYVEGEYVLVAPIQTAQIESLSVKRGDRVEKGATIGKLEQRDAEIAVAQAEAALAQAKSQLADLQTGRRPEELDVLAAAVDQAKANLANLEQGARPDEIAALEAAVAQAKANLANLQQGARPDELSVQEANLNAARATLADAERTVEREMALVKRGISAQARLDTAIANRDKAAAAVDQAAASLSVAKLPARDDQIKAAEAQVAQAEANLAASRLPARDDQIKAAQAQVAQAEANLSVAKLPGRPDQIAAAEAAVKNAAAVLEQARWQLGQRVLIAPETGMITDIIRNPGELGGPQAPVLSLLPDGAIKVRFYVPETALATLHTGTRMTVRCDACGDGTTATVTYVADEPEFTPPVIYSLESRQKLVWLIEARPDDDALRLKPGQIVDGDIAPDATQ